LETRGGKILEFLRENSHLDLEVPDIAFNVKKSEKTVEAALKKFQQKGLVTSRQNEYGRVYWYALPSAPITKTFKLEDLKASKENAASAGVSDDDEVDLSDLANMSAEEPAPKPEPVKEQKVPEKKQKRKKGKDKEKPDPKNELELPPAPKTEMVPPPIIEQNEEEFNLEDAADFDVAPQDAAPPTPAPAPAETEPVQPTPEQEPEPEMLNSEEDESMSAQPESKAQPPVLLAIVIFGIISIGALVKGCGTTGKLNELESKMPKDAIQAQALDELKTEQAAKIDELENKLAAMTKKFNNLSASVDSIVDASQAVKKKVVKRRPTRRRRR